MRPLLVLTTFVFLASLRPAAQAPAGSAGSEALQTWIAKQAVAIRSIDPNDEDFSDLEPLVAAIGSARVVQLGEPSHGAGSAFAAKARLIKFLHRRLGFDVIAWESGFYDVRLTQRAMRAGEDAIAAAQRGVLAVWSNAAEARPLFEYVRASQSTARPIDMAGIDMNISAGGSEEALLGELRTFAATLSDASRRQQAAAVVERTIVAYERVHARLIARQRKVRELLASGLSNATLQEPLRAWDQDEGGKHRPTAAAFAEFRGAANELLATIQRDRPAFDAVHGARRVAFMMRAIENMRGRTTSVYSRERPDALAEAQRIGPDWNLRDTLMAENLRWLLDEEYVDRKAIVWAHNAHVMHGYFAPNWAAVHDEMPANGMMSAGVPTVKWLKDGVYTIALTTYVGDEAWTNGQRRGPIAPAAEGSFEARLHALNNRYVFLDLRAARGDGHPMRTPQSLRISGYGPPTGPHGNDRVPDLTKAFDGIFFIDRMAPATMICQGRCP